MSVSWLDIIRYKLGLHQSEVMEEDWAAIERKMKEESQRKGAAFWKNKLLVAEASITEEEWTGVLDKMKKKKHRAIYWRAALSTVLFFGLGFLGTYFQPEEQVLSTVIHSNKELNDNQIRTTTENQTISSELKSEESATQKTGEIPEANTANPATTESETALHDGILNRELPLQQQPLHTLPRTNRSLKQRGSGFSFENALIPRTYTLVPSLPEQSALLLNTQADNLSEPKPQSFSEAASSTAPEKTTEGVLSTHTEETVAQPDEILNLDTVIVFKPGDASLLADKKTKKSNWHLDFYGGMGVNNWQNNPTRGTSGIEVKEDLANFYSYIPQLSVYGGWKQWRMQLGAQYTRFDLSGDYKHVVNIYDSIPYRDPGGQIIGYFYLNYRDTSINNSYVGVLKYWQIPIGISRNFRLNGKTQLQTGVSFTLGLGGGIQHGIRWIDPVKLKKVNWSYAFNIGLERHIQGPFWISGGLNYYYQPTSVFQSGSALQSRFQGLGLQLRLRYALF